MEILSQADIEAKEALTLDRLSKIYGKINKYYSADAVVYADACPRKPFNNYIELVNWVKDQFGNEISKPNHIFIHNRVNIDGQFVLFCEENNIDIKCLYKESIISWKTDNDHEKFFAQGVFLISFDNHKFIHSALFHKGNQNEDEVSFSILVSETDYEAYIELRNKFDIWLKRRDRSDLNIHVVGGEDIPYVKEHSWDDIFLPTKMKQEIKSLVEIFLSSKDFYVKNKIPWKRGIMLYGNPGVGKTTLIKTLISQYDFKPVTMVAGGDDNIVREAFAYAETQSPSLLYFEDLDSMLDNTVDISTFLNLMDGISTKNGLLIVATANNIKKIKKNVDRPSRFDRKYEIPLPDKEMSLNYLEKWFEKSITSKKLDEIVQNTVSKSFSYAHLKELYISSMYESLARNAKSINEKDIKKALDRLIKDKCSLEQKPINIDNYGTKNQS
jgi:adenylate kinase family enzyme